MSERRATSTSFTFLKARHVGVDRWGLVGVSVTEWRSWAHLGIARAAEEVSLALEPSIF